MTHSYDLETSEPLLIEQCSGSKLQKAQEIMLSAEVTRPHQTITCSVMCDDIGEIGLPTCLLLDHLLTILL